MNITHIAALLTITLTTNEVKLGTATIGAKTFDVVGLQVVTNRTIISTGIMDSFALILGTTNSINWSEFKQERWTNTYPGPFVATNLVPAANVVWVFSATNTMNWYPNLTVTNFSLNH